MAWGLSRTHYSPIAIDFGADSLKLLQIIPSDPPQLAAAGSIDVPEDARNDPKARYAFFAEAIREVMSTYSFKGRKAICSIPAYQTLVQHLQVSRTDDPSEIDEQVNQHLRDRLNVDPSRMVVRYFTVGQVIREGAAKQEILCLATSRDVAMSYVNIAGKARLDLVGMHGEQMAILRAFAHLYRRQGDEQRVTCFIDLGGATTKVAIAHGTQLVFAKTIHVGGDQFTRQMAQAGGMTFSETRLRRIQEAGSGGGRAGEPSVQGSVDLVRRPPANAGMRTLDGNDVARAVATTETAAEPVAGVAGPDMNETLDCLLDELQLCVRYHQRTFPDRQVEKVVFLGGESRHVWLCQKIARTLRISAQLGDPVARLVRVNQKNVGIDMRQPQPGWAVPMGLCLSEANL